MTDNDVLFCAVAAAWRRWLEYNHADADAVWLVVTKKVGTRPGPSYAEALDDALWFGWMDSQLATLDADSSLRRFSLDAAVKVVF